MTVQRVLILALCATGCAGRVERPHRAAAPIAPPPSAAVQAALEGRGRLAAGDRDGARAAFERAKTLDPKDPSGDVGLAALATAGGDLALARTELGALRARGLDPSEIAPWLTAAVDGARAAPPQAPVAPSAAAAPTDPGNGATPADADLAQLFRSGRFDDVIKTVSAEADPSLFRRKLLADAYYDHEDWEKAVEAYRQVLRREPGNEPVTQYLADALFRLGRFDESMAFYRVLAESHPDRPGFWRLIADAAMAKGDDALAMAMYSKAVERGYNGPDVKARVEALKAKLAPK